MKLQKGSHSVICYPKWVHLGGNLDDLEIRRRRLTFIIRRISLQVDPTSSYRAVAQIVGIEPQTISRHIKAGGFPRKLALRFQACFGDDLAPYELLIDPFNEEMFFAQEDHRLAAKLCGVPMTTNIPIDQHVPKKTFTFEEEEL